MKRLKRLLPCLLALAMMLAAPGALAQEKSYTVLTRGFQSDVAVTVVLNEDWVITSVQADVSGETDVLATPCGEEAFLSQFVGLNGPCVSADIVSGATYTSNAIIQAVNSIFVSETRIETMPGMFSDVTVTVTLSANGSIYAIYADISGETQSIAAPCAEYDFLSQFLGRTGPFADVDVVAGATHTSNAIIQAVNKAFIVEPLTATARGMMSDVTVTVTLAPDGTIYSIHADVSGETPAIAAPCGEYDFLSQFLGKAGPFTEVDMVSGATYTSNAIVQAINKIFIGEQLTATAPGLLSDVTVTVTLAPDGTIYSIHADVSGETPAIAAPCGEYDFLSQFLGKAGPFTEVDTISGATVTSNAVVQAINSLFEQQ